MASSIIDFEGARAHASDHMVRGSAAYGMVRAGATPTDVLGRVLGGLDYQELEAQPVEFCCGCNEQRAARATMALGEGELRDMIAKNETAEVCCHFCGKRYYLDTERLRELLGRG